MTRMQVALLTSGDPDRVTGGYLFHRRVADRATVHDADVGFVSVPDVPLPWAIASGPRWLGHEALRRADVLVLDSIAAAAAAPWLGSIRVPIVGMLHQPAGGMEGSRLARAVRAPLDRWAYRRAALLMAASDWLAEQLVADGVPRSRLRVVPPGKDPASGADDQADDAEQLRPALRAGRHLAALCIANWLPRKGLVELLEAVARLPDDVVTLHLVGENATGGSYARRVGARAASRPLRDRVVVHGLVPAETVRRLYRASDAFVLPSFEEPYGTVWGEAMAAGLPVIGWQAGNLPFLADHGREGLLLPPGDVPGLSTAIESLAADPERRLQMGRAAAARAESRTTWDETAASFFGVIQQVVLRERGRSEPD